MANELTHYPKVVHKFRVSIVVTWVTLNTQYVQKDSSVWRIAYNYVGIKLNHVAT